MSCSLRNKCEALYCETCKVGADGRTNYKESEQYQQGRADVIDELRTELIDMIRGDEEFTAWQKEEIILCIKYVIGNLKEQK